MKRSTMMMLLLFGIIFMVMLESEMLLFKFNEIDKKLNPKTIKCDKCSSMNIEQKSDNPNDNPKIKTMSEIASQTLIITQLAICTNYTYELTCRNCGYSVKFTRTY